MSALTATILLLLLLVVCVGPRRWALLGVTAGVFFLTQGHYITVAGVEFTPVRILQVAGFARVTLRRELDWSGLQRLDWTVVLLYNYTALVWLVGPTGFSPRPFSLALDGTLCYLAFRGLVKGIDDVRWFLYAFVGLLVPYTALVVVERQTAGLPFAAVGGTWEMYFRNGVPRCQGSFRHAIILGTVAASFLSLYIGLWLEGGHRRVALLGFVLCLVLVVLSNSGIPLTAATTAVVGWLAWVVRRRMAGVRLALLGLFVALAIVMKDSIWYLPFRVSQIVGGTGYHRSVLMEKAWQNLSHWWLAGMRIEDTATWFPYEMFYGGADVTNQYLIFGFRGGLLTMALFIYVLVLAFRGLGEKLARVRGGAEGPRGQFLLWGLGVTVFVHVVAWTSLAYFDQSYAVWLMQLALVSACVRPSGAEADDRIRFRGRNSRFTALLPLRQQVSARAVDNLGATRVGGHARDRRAQAFPSPWCG